MCFGIPGASLFDFCCAPLRHRWLLISFDAVIAALSLAIVVLVTIPITLKADPDMDIKGLQVDLVQPHCFTNSIPYANIRVTDGDLNAHFNLPDGTFLSPVLRDMGRCHMAVANASEKDGYDLRWCNRVEAQWAVVALVISSLAVAEFILGLLLGKYPSTLVWEPSTMCCRGRCAFVLLLVWLIPVCFFLTRKPNVGAWYIRQGKIHPQAYFEESICWLVAGWFCVVIVGLKFVLILIYCSVEEPPSKKESDDRGYWQCNQCGHTSKSAKVKKERSERESKSKSQTSQSKSKSDLEKTEEEVTDLEKRTAMPLLTVESAKSAKAKPKRKAKWSDICFLEIPDDEAKKKGCRGKDAKKKKGKVGSQKAVSTTNDEIKKTVVSLKTSSPLLMKMQSKVPMQKKVVQTGSNVHVQSTNVQKGPSNVRVQSNVQVNQKALKPFLQKNQKTN